MSEITPTRNATDRELLAVALRVLGLVWLLILPMQISRALATLTFIQSDPTMNRFVKPIYAYRTVLPPAFLLVTSVVLLVFGGSVARWMMGRGQLMPSAGDANRPRVLFALAARVLGIALGVYGLTQLYGGVVDVLRWGELDAAQDGFRWDITRRWGPAFTGGATFLVGVFIAAGARFISKFAYRPWASVPKERGEGNSPQR